MEKEIKEVEIKDWLRQFSSVADHSLVSSECWSNMPIKNRLWNYAQMISGGAYEIHPEDKQSYSDLCDALENGRSIVLRGPAGSGKSTLTRIISKITYYAGHPKRYQFASVFKIIEEFSLNGFPGIQKYYSGHWIFDDVGREMATSKGTQINGGGPIYNVMGLILDNQYKNIPLGRSSFILSTNFGEVIRDGKEVSQFEEHYTKQVSDRIKQGAVLIKITGCNYRDKFSVDLITVFPEVLHTPDDIEMSEEERAECKKIATKIQESLQALAKKYTTEQVNEKRSPQKFLKPTDFEEACWDWFDKAWGKQGSMLANGLTGSAIIKYAGKIYNREAFAKMCVQLANQK